MKKVLHNTRLVIHILYHAVSSQFFIISKNSSYFIFPDFISSARYSRLSTATAPPFTPVKEVNIKTRKINDRIECFYQFSEKKLTKQTNLIL